MLYGIMFYADTSPGEYWTYDFSSNSMLTIYSKDRVDNHVGAGLILKYEYNAPSYIVK